MVASQGGGRISYRFPSPHPKGIAGPGKSLAERAGLLPPPPPTGTLSPKTAKRQHPRQERSPHRQHSSHPQVRLKHPRQPGEGERRSESRALPSGGAFCLRYSGNLFPSPSIPSVPGPPQP
ncbi:uncharacterized protein LOC116993749 [Catharus ustulatus]|uniref:uncharacterized protein LOC116993749 n=1 Tax=Catharus ustulatus TaxID=91951 RepID=UPI001409CAFE|nr:uncharacterized protein LOC116993749 [Catharus ustulatus]